MAESIINKDLRTDDSFINFTNYLKDGNTFGMKPEPMVPGSSVMDG